MVDQIQMRDGTTTEDPRLGRLEQFDPRSRDYPIRALVGGKKPRSYTWRIAVPHLIDQGREGACVGFAVVNELQARPAESRFGNRAATDDFALRNVYWEAQKIDPWPGGAYPNASPQYGGTSVLAGMKVAQSLGYFDEYRWTFTLEDLVIGLGRHGPAVLGLAWFDSNYSPGPDGFISPDGRKVGGHAVLARAVKVVWRDGASWEADGWGAVDLDASYVTIRNSWGRWGYKDSGDCFVTLRDLGRWIDIRGEGVFAVHRSTEADPE